MTTSKRKISITSLCITGLFFGFGCTSTVTIESLLQEMPDREQITYFPEKEYRLIQSSSYNRQSVGPDTAGWYANADFSYFVRVEENHGRREFVMLDDDGPGAIVRWWMTFYQAQHGIIRVYLDRDTVPVIEGPPYEVLSGQILAPSPFSVAVPEEAPVVEKGNNLYVPIPFAEHCKITYECDSLVFKEDHYKPDVFYNICYRKYETGTKVETFSVEALKQAANAFEEAGELLENYQPSASSYQDLEQMIPPGDSATIQFSQTGSAVCEITFEIDAPDIQQALRSTVFTSSFDGTQTAWLPVGEFFGTGYQLLSHHTWMNKTEENGLMKSFWIMPFREQCRLSFHNYGTDTVIIKAHAGLCDYRWEPNSLYFGASWHEYHHIKTRDENNWFFDVNFVDVRGKGIYAGDQVTLFNMADTWWGEGDEKIFVDGEDFPSSFGTGSEDYYGYAFGHPEPFSHPFISQPTGAGNFNPGLTINMRLRSLDAIPFTSSISSNMELWHWRSTCINYAMTSFYYVQFPYSANIEPDIESVRRPVARSEDDFYSGTPADSCYTIEHFRQNNQ